MAASAAKERGPRLNIVITDEDQTRINRLSTLLDGATTTSVIKRSLKMNEYIMERITEGSTIKVVGADGHEYVLAVL